MRSTRTVHVNPKSGAAGAIYARSHGCGRPKTYEFEELLGARCAGKWMGLMARKDQQARKGAPGPPFRPRAS